MIIVPKIIFYINIKLNAVRRNIKLQICIMVPLALISYAEVGIFGESAKPLEIAEMSQIEKLTKSPAWNDRYRAAFLIGSSSIADTAWALETLLKGIQIELRNPSSLKMSPGSYATNSEKVLQKYVEVLVHLGPSIRISLRHSIDTLSGDFKNWIIIVLGFLKDESVHEELKAIFSSSSNLFIRLMSIEALGTYADTTDIPIILEAYSDTSKVTMTMDHDVPGGDFKEDIRPLVGAALFALGKMGYTIQSEGDHIILKKLGD